MQRRGKRIADSADNGLTLDVPVERPGERWLWVTDTPLSIGVLLPCVMEMDEEGIPWCSSQEFTNSSVFGRGATSSCSLDRYALGYAPYLHRSNGTCEYVRERMNGEHALDVWGC